MKKKLIAIGQVVFGISLIALLVITIHRGSQCVEFTVPPSTVEDNAIYQVTSDTGTNLLFVTSPVENSDVVAMLAPSKPFPELNDAGSLTLVDGTGPRTLEWSSYTTRPYGLPRIGQSFMAALDRWPILLIGWVFFGICLIMVSLRWSILLKAQSLDLSIGRVTQLTFIGHFFNSFFIGSTGGDIMKAYMVTKHTPQKKSAAVATVFIDRIIGLLALVLMTVIVMLARLDFFLSHPNTRIALVFNTALFFGAIAFLFAVFRQNLLEKWSFFRRLEEKTSLGSVLAKMYNASHLCFTSFSVFVKTLILSFLNQAFLLLCAYFVSIAMNLNLSFIDIITVFPIINAVGAIPLTPGGLGTREATAIFLLGVMGVSTPNALMLSLLIYMGILIWSMIGGVVYFWTVSRAGESIPPATE